MSATGRNPPLLFLETFARFKEDVSFSWGPCGILLHCRVTDKFFISGLALSR